ELKASDIELEIVDTGQKCLARLDQGAFDALLLDFHLPDMDGIDVLRQLTENEFSLPVIMVTAAGDESLVIQVLRLGAADYVPKQSEYLENLPVVLKNAVAQWRSLNGQARALTRRPGRILYIEHHAADIDLTLHHFAEAAPHFSVQVVRNAGNALEIL